MTLVDWKKVYKIQIQLPVNLNRPQQKQQISGQKKLTKQEVTKKGKAKAIAAKQQKDRGEISLSRYQR